MIFRKLEYTHGEETGPAMAINAQEREAGNERVLRVPDELLSRWAPLLASRAPRVALADGEDDRAVVAASRLAEHGLVQPVLVGRLSLVEAACERTGVALPASVDIVDVEAACGDEELFGILSTAEPTEEAAAERLADPVYLTAALLRAGRVDAAVAGATRTTADVLRAGIRVVGLAEESRWVSSSFLMVLPDGRVLGYGDCAVLPEPTDEQLAEVAAATADTYARLTGATPVVAILSFSTHGSAEHPSVHKVRRATEMVKAARPTLLVDGELQFDSAVVETVGRSKAGRSPVAGRANVLIFPDLNAGNIGYKITERLGRAHAVGPILQGLARPLNDLSRGCSADDICTVALTGAMQSAGTGMTP